MGVREIRDFVVFPQSHGHPLELVVLDTLSGFSFFVKFHVFWIASVLQGPKEAPKGNFLLVLRDPLASLGDFVSHLGPNLGSFGSVAAESGNLFLMMEVDCAHGSLLTLWALGLPLSPYPIFCYYRCLHL